MLRAIAILFSLVIPPVLCAQNKSAEKEKKPAKFKVVKLGDPVSYLEHYSGNAEIQKAELLEADSLKIKYCFNLPSEYIILKYKFSASVNGQYYSYAVKGSRIPSELKNVLANTVNGDKIRFTNIVAVCKDSVKKKFPDIVLKVLDKKDTSLITYKLKNKIPEPDLFSVKNQLPNKISKLELLFLDQLLVKCDCLIPSLSTTFSVIAFDLKATIKGAKRIFSVTGSDLTQEMRKALQQVHTGTKFRIENIKVKTTDGIVGYLSPRTFKVIAP